MNADEESNESERMNTMASGQAAPGASPPAPPMPGAPVTPKTARASRKARREGVTGNSLMAVAAIALLVATLIFLGFSTVSASVAFQSFSTTDQLDSQAYLIWGSSGTQYAYTPFLFVIIGVVLLLVQPRPLKAATPDAREEFKKNLDQMGARTLFRVKHTWSLPVRWALTLALWLSAVALLFFYYSEMADRHLSLRTGFYITCILIGAGLAATLLLWPFGAGRKRVVVAADGGFRLE